MNSRCWKTLLSACNAHSSRFCLSWKIPLILSFDPFIELVLDFDIFGLKNFRIAKIPTRPIKRPKQRLEYDSSSKSSSLSKQQWNQVHNFWIKPGNVVTVLLPKKTSKFEASSNCWMSFLQIFSHSNNFASSMNFLAPSTASRSAASFPISPLWPLTWTKTVSIVFRSSSISVKTS